MKSNTRRGVPQKDDIPFRNQEKHPTGVTVSERLSYNGASITIYRRDIGIAGPRVAYTARIKNEATAESTYLGYHARKDEILAVARQWVDERAMDSDKPNYVRMTTRQRAWELWYEDGENGEKPSENESE